MKSLMLGIVIVGLWAASAPAQESLLVSSSAVQVGDPLRATLPDHSIRNREGIVTGNYAGLSPTRLLLSTTLSRGEIVREIDLNEIVRLERSRRRTVGEGAGRGAIWGAATGALVGFGLIAMCSGDDFFNCGGSDFVIGPAFFGGIGAGVGAAIGMAARGTTWEDVSVRR